MLLQVVEVLSKHAGLWITRDKEIMYSQATHINFICPMRFDNFPLDTQVIDHNILLSYGKIIISFSDMQVSSWFIFLWHGKNDIYSNQQGAGLCENSTFCCLGLCCKFGQLKFWKSFIFDIVTGECFTIKTGRSSARLWRVGKLQCGWLWNGSKQVSKWHKDEQCVYCLHC